jgi:hypothetical protein
VTSVLNIQHENTFHFEYKIRLNIKKSSQPKESEMKIKTNKIFTYRGKEIAYFGG